MHGFYRRTLDVVLRHQFLTLMVFFATMALSIHLYVIIPKGFFPTQDTGLVTGFAESAQDVSPQEMARMMVKLGDRGGERSRRGRGRLGHGQHRQRADRQHRPLLHRAEAARSAHGHGVGHHQPAAPAARQGRGREPRAPGRRRTSPSAAASAAGQYQYTLQDADLAELNDWAPKILAKLQTLPELADTSSDLQNNAPQLAISINRDQAARFGILPQVIDATLNDAFGQRQVAQYYTQTDTYTVVLEVPPSMQGKLETLDNIYLKSPLNGQAGAALDAGHHRQHEGRPALGVASGPVSGGDHLLQPAAGRGARPGDRRDQ